MELDENFWKSQCAKFPSNTIDVIVVMSKVIDYFKPVPDLSMSNKERFCKMLMSNQNHMWSNNGMKWLKPNYEKFSHFGGSAPDYPKAKVSGDDRKFFSIWGSNQKGNRGGCCTGVLTSNKVSWGYKFKMLIRTGVLLAKITKSDFKWR